MKRLLVAVSCGVAGLLAITEAAAQSEPATGSERSLVRNPA